MIPCLTIDKNAEYKWVRSNDKIGIQKPFWSYRKKLSIHPDEYTSKIIRFDRNIFSIWTNFANLYEISSKTIKMHLKTTTVPTYANGWYIGWCDNKITMVKRSEPNICIESTCKLNVTNLVYLPYTQFLILNTHDGCYRAVLENKQLQDIQKLVDTYDIIAVDSDSGILAFAHNNGIDVVWARSWKIYHKIATKPSISLFINKTKLLSVSKLNEIYMWDCTSGLQTLFISVPWHNPIHVYFNDLDDTIISVDSAILTVWSQTNELNWSTMDIFPDCKLVATVPIGVKPVQFCVKNSQIMVHTQDEVYKMSLSIESNTFTYSKNIVKWIKNPLNHLDVEFDNYLHSLLKKTIKCWGYNILNNIVEYKMSCNYNLRKIFKSNRDIKHAFEDLLNTYVVKNYALGAFENREFCLNFVFFVKHMELYLDMEALKLPEHSCDFIIWIEMQEINEGCLKKALKDRGILETEYLHAVQDMIVNWDILFESQDIFFLTSKNVLKSCKEGYTNKWIRIFENLDQCKMQQNDVKETWNTICNYILSIETLSNYSFPNTNDGSWKKLDSVKNDTWVIINEVVHNTTSLDIDEISLPVVTWVPHSESPNNVLERALCILDSEYWIQKGSEWIKYEDHELVTGTQITCSAGSGYLLEWPYIILQNNNGKVTSIAYDDDIYYRKVYFDFSIDANVRLSAINYIRDLVAMNKMTKINDMYKNTVIKLLQKELLFYPMHVQTGISSIAIDANIWLGNKNGRIQIKNMIQINAHKDNINAMDNNFGMVASCSDDKYIRLWDMESKQMILEKKHKKNIKCIKFESIHCLWLMDDDNDIWVWDFKLMSKPKRIEYESHIKPNEIVPLYSLDILKNVAITVTNKITVWHTKYPYDIKQIIKDKTATCIALLSEEDYVYGTSTGKLYLCSIHNSEQILAWHDPKEFCTAITCIHCEEDYCVAIGTMSGKIACISLEINIPIIASWSVNSRIIQIEYKNPRIYILTEDYCLYYITFDHVQVNTLYKCLLNITTCPKWKQFIALPENIKILQNSIISVDQSGKQFDFSLVIDECIKDYNNRKNWCTPKMLDVLLNGLHHYPQQYRRLLDKLFCFTGKLFKCSLCLCQTTSMKKDPICILKSCGHKYHYNCILKHVQKTMEWDSICLHEWALSVTLKCPKCRKEFGKQDIMIDNFISDICEYNSDEELV